MNMFEDFKNRNGTALLVALLVMGILTAVSLTISALIIKELRMTRLVLDSGEAYYAAESGVEVALLELEMNLPGFEPEVSGLEIEDGAKVSVSVGNKSNQYPHFDSEEYDLEWATADMFYDVLDLNESVTVPLFAVDEEGGVTKVTEFRVQFYVGFSAEDLGVDVVGDKVLTSWDILRWKIYGISDSSGGTESVNDFTAVSTLVGGDAGDGTLTGASTPSWFGSVENCEKGLSEKIECLGFGALPDPILTVVTDEATGETQMVYDGACSPWQAREHYSYDATGDAEVFKCYNIRTFLGNHSYNYLTLTNLMNPAVFAKGLPVDVKAQLSRLYFRIEAYDGELVREYADISSVGESGDSRVELNVLKKRDSYLPVFNFALYHTGEE